MRCRGRGSLLALWLGLSLWLGPPLAPSAGGTAHAHNRDVATFVIEPVAASAKGPDGPAARGWLLSMHLPSTALYAATVIGLDPTARSALTERAFKARAVAYLKRHVRVTRGDQPIALGSGGIRLGPHQSDLRFLLVGMPVDGGPLTVEIDAFSEDGHQSNVLKVRGAQRQTVTLTADRDYRATVRLRR